VNESFYIYLDPNFSTDSICHCDILCGSESAKLLLKLTDYFRQTVSEVSVKHVDWC